MLFFQFFVVQPGVQQVVNQIQNQAVQMQGQAVQMQGQVGPMPVQAGPMQGQAQGHVTQVGQIQGQQPQQQQMSQRLLWQQTTPQGHKQYFQLDPQTHQQLQAMEPAQRQIFIQKLQKRQQLIQMQQQQVRSRQFYKTCVWNPDIIKSFYYSL
jgi:hypothetical protein